MLLNIIAETCTGVHPAAAIIKNTRDMNSMLHPRCWDRTDFTSSGTLHTALTSAAR